MTAEQWQAIVARAWADPQLKKRLLADPAAVLKENGVTPQRGVVYKVVEDTGKVVHLAIPTPPAEQELAEEQLDRVAGGGIKVDPSERVQRPKKL